MAESLVTRDRIRAMASEAFHAGRHRDSHGFNWHADALPTWLEEFDRLTAQANASPQSHSAPAGRQGFDVRQGVAA